jgi:hypothetical protein
VEPGAQCSEERRLPCPGGRGSLPTRPWALAGSRWGAAPPKRSGSLSRWSGVPRLRRGPVPCPGEVVRAALRRVPVAVPRWNRAMRPPKRPSDLVPVEPSSRCSEERRLPCPGGRVPCRVGRGTGVRRRGFNTMMLRSAEADPHVIEHTARSGAEAPVSAMRNCPVGAGAEAPPPLQTIEPPPGAGSAPDDRDEALPAARRPPPGFRGRGHGVSVTLRPHPPRWADV